MNDKRKAFKKISAKLYKWLPHLGDANRHEADAWRMRIIELLHQWGLSGPTLSTSCLGGGR